MNRIMFILFVVISVALGFGVNQIVMLIAKRVDNKFKACTYSCLLGIALIMVLLIIAYLLMPDIGRATGQTGVAL